MEILRDASPHAWMQVYLSGDPPQAEAISDRIARAGFEVLVVHRPPLYFAKAIGGAAAVRHGITLLEAEILRMAMAGADSMADLGPSILAAR
jgi:isopentenyl diphosphate isomerase/L-lactate dehydrogenase-like FMN-dependent dehydrogenase